MKSNTPVFSIPPSVRRGSEIFAALTNEKQRTLEDCLSDKSLGYSRTKLAESIASKLKVEVPDAKRLISTFVSLNNAQEMFSNADWDSLTQELELQRPGSTEALHSLIKLDAINIIAKSDRLILEAEHLYIDSAIYTDVRPIFGDSVTEGPAALSIIHSLKIEHRQPGNPFPCQTMVRLDIDELKALKEATERAIQKEEALMGKLGAIAPWVER